MGSLPILLAFLCLGLFLAGSPALVGRVHCPFQVNQGEAINVEFARNLKGGVSLYHDPSTGPYLYAAYPPLFPWLESMLMKFVQGPWFPGRLLALAGYCGCALAFVYSAWRRWGAWSALTLGSIFLLSPTWAAWGTMVRADSLMIFLEFLAFLLLLKASERASTKKHRAPIWTLLAAGSLTALALMVKQNAVLLVLAYALYCFKERKGRDFLLYSLAALLPPAALLAILQGMTGGWFLKYILWWAPLGYQPALLAHYLTTSFLPECGWILAGAALAWPFTKGLARYQAALSLTWVLGLGRQGAAENYYLEFILFGLFLIGEGWTSAWGRAWSFKTGGRPVLRSLLVVLGLASFSFCGKPWPSSPSIEEQRMKADAAKIYLSPGEHLALDLDLPLLAGKRIWLQPLEYTWMVGKGLWSEEPLLNDIREKKFSTIEFYDIPEQYLLPPGVVGEIEKNYHPFLRQYGRIWLAPNPS